MRETVNELLPASDLQFMLFHLTLNFSSCLDVWSFFLGELNLINYAYNCYCLF
jgi:hypothetical protein